MTDRPTCLECNAPEGSHHTDECSMSGVVGAESSAGEKEGDPKGLVAQAQQVSPDTATPRAAGPDASLKINYGWDTSMPDAQPTPSEAFYEWWNLCLIDAPGLSDACKWSAWNAWIYRERAIAQAQAELAAANARADNERNLRGEWEEQALLDSQRASNERSAREAAERRHKDEHDIVAKVWSALGIHDYAGAAGLTIWQIVAALKSRLATVEAALEGTLSWLSSYPGHGADKAYERARAALAAKEGK